MLHHPVPWTRQPLQKLQHSHAIWNSQSGSLSRSPLSRLSGIAIHRNASISNRVIASCTNPCNASIFISRDSEGGHPSEQMADSGIGILLVLGFLTQPNAPMATGVGLHIPRMRSRTTLLSTRRVLATAGTAGRPYAASRMMTQSSGRQLRGGIRKQRWQLQLDRRRYQKQERFQKMLHFSISRRSRSSRAVRGVVRRTTGSFASSTTILVTVGGSLAVMPQNHVKSALTQRLSRWEGVQRAINVRSATTVWNCCITPKSSNSASAQLSRT
mmetsp:Transcript_32958/g.64884  ORF Transcript_32958/g.64884 Transcript_32958/m.64884 type:complete len:271 (+) Transcript_32958:230-1042(+)